MFQKLKDKVNDIVVDSKNVIIDRNKNQFFNDLQREMEMEEE